MADATLQHHSVVVVGGGFAGATCAERLGKRGIHVTLVDQHNYSQFQPLLYQLATAQVMLLSVAWPLRERFATRTAVDVKLARIASIDPATRSVTSDDGVTFQGDHLVIAAGSRPNFFDTPGADKWAFPLYALADAERLRSRVFSVFEDADRKPELIERGALNIVVVGGGSTGVETAGALGDLIKEVMPRRYPDLAVDAAQVTLVDPGSVVLAPFSERAHEYAADALRRKGVHLELGACVTEVAQDRVTLSDGRQILTRTVVWAGGIQGAELLAQSGLPLGHGGRVDVQPDLTVAGFPGVYAIGDAANMAGSDGQPLPQLGSVALQAGRSAANNIIADLDGRLRTPFRYHDKGIMAMIGRDAAIFEVGPRRREFDGKFAFVSWLGVHAYLLSGWHARIVAVRSWAWDYLSKRRALSIIDRPDAARIDWDQP